MPAVVTELKQAIVAAINGATWSQPVVTARGTRLPIRKLRELDGVVVEVVSRAITTEDGDRESDVWMFGFDLGVGRKLTGDDADREDQADMMDSLTQEMMDFFGDKSVKWLADPVTHCTEVGLDPVYSPAHFEEDGVFLAVLQLTMQCVR